MDVELLIVAGCPHTDQALELLRQALDEGGVGAAAIRTVTVTTHEQALQLQFPGSPTILLDGADPFPQPRQLPGLACRLYPGVDGPAGLPDRTALTAALARASIPAPPAAPTSVLTEEQRRSSEADQAATDIAAGR